MRLQALTAAALALCACAPGSGRVEVLSRSRTFKARTLAIAATRGGGTRSIDVARALSRRLDAGGTRAAALEESENLLAGAALTLESAADLRLLAEVRRATGADAVVFLTLDPEWRGLELTVLDAGGGDAVLHAAARPAGKAYLSADEVAAAAAEALAEISPERRKASAAARDPETPDEIPVP